MAKVSPMQHLKRITESYPGMSSWVSTCLQDKGKPGEPDWPNWCFMPMAAWAALIQVRCAGLDPFLKELAVSADLARLSAIGMWRYSQGIYRYDADLLSALADSKLSGELPSKVFRRLPEWCVYIETPGFTWLGSALHGFWAHLEWDYNLQREELRLLLNTDRGLAMQPLHLGNWSIEEALHKTLKFTLANAQRNTLTSWLDIETLARLSPLADLKPLVSILLYLCSEAPDVDPLRMPQPRPSRPDLKNGKRGRYIFTPEKPKVFPVGGVIGPMLRNAIDSEVTGRTVRTHLRRGHWHGFWKGPRSGVRNFIYHWIAPLVVVGRKQSEVMDAETFESS